MLFAATVLILAAIAWAAFLAHRAPLSVCVVLLVVVAYVFGHEFWSARIGQLPLTLDRMLLVGLLGAFVVQWRRGVFSLRKLNGSDYVLAVFCGVLILSALFSGQPEITGGVTSKWGRLFASFAVPVVVYAIARQVPLSQRVWTWILGAFVALGFYLALTGVVEVAGLWSFVFPLYIADPNLGIHFGRARGPDLNSVSLGLYLTACMLCDWALLPRVRERWQQLILMCALPLFALTILLTYTRSTWIGLAASSLIVAAFQIPHRWRVPAVVSGVLAGTLLVCATWGHLMGLRREGSAAEAEHSVDQRSSFAYVSWQMFRDRPVLGVGFGRFYDQKLPYLSDRRQTVELESIRDLHHHNTLLSLLTETGLVGIAAFVAVFLAWSRSAWRLAMMAGNLDWVRSQGILMIGVVTNFLCSAMFHDLTLLPSQELLLFVFAGFTVNLQQAAFASVTSTSAAMNDGVPATPFSNKPRLQPQH